MSIEENQWNRVWSWSWGKIKNETRMKTSCGKGLILLFPQKEMNWNSRFWKRWIRPFHWSVFNSCERIEGLALDDGFSANGPPSHGSSSGWLSNPWCGWRWRLIRGDHCWKLALKLSWLDDWPVRAGTFAWHSGSGHEKDQLVNVMWFNKSPAEWELSWARIGVVQKTNWWRREVTYHPKMDFSIWVPDLTLVRKELRQGSREEGGREMAVAVRGPLVLAHSFHFPRSYPV